MILDVIFPIHHGFCECACLLFRHESLHWCHASYILTLLFEEPECIDPKAARSLVQCRCCLGAFVFSCVDNRGLVAIMLS